MSTIDSVPKSCPNVPKGLSFPVLNGPRGDMPGANVCAGQRPKLALARCDARNVSLVLQAGGWGFESPWLHVTQNRWSAGV